MAILSNLELIRRVPLFAPLSEAQAVMVSEALVKQRYRRRAVIVEQGTKSDALFIMLDGLARVSMLGQRNREIILATLRPGDYIGEMSLIDEGPHSATVRAQQQTDILVLRRAHFERCMYDNPGFSHAVMQSLAQRLRHANRKIEALALLNVHDRVLRTLRDTVVRNLDDQLVIPEKISHQDLARMVGASREMVSRVMKELQENGRVRILETGLISLLEEVE